MPPNRQPAHRPPRSEDQQLAALRRRLPGWDAWYVRTPNDPGSGYTWCARPSGAEIATCHGGIPDELVKAIAEFEADLSEHIETAREDLERTPDREASRRSLLARQISAMKRLHGRTDPHPTTPPDEARHP
jgi:hypothetical protein